MAMHTTYCRKISIVMIFTAALLFSPIKSSFAQLDDLGAFIEGGAEDAQLLLQEYIRPFGSGFGGGINSGWVDRAGTHGLFGFHVKVSATSAFVPSSDRSFDVNALNMENLFVLHGDDPVTPTFSGSSDSGPMLGFRSQHPQTGEMVEYEAFRMPEGTGLRFIPTPMVQAGVGLPKNTELMIRFVPTLSFDDYGEFHLLGFGAKHELNQWIPGGRLLPITLSVMAGYTTIGSETNLEARPTPDEYEQVADGVDVENDWDDQRIRLNTNAFTMNLLVGRSLPVFSFYGGIGFETSTTSVKMDGNYPYYILVESDGDIVRELNALADPIDFSVDGSNSLRAMAGIRIRLFPFTLNVDYTLADYSMVSAGFGISFR
ncbi:hypothetical protein QA596_02860 [Balneolales bacterium ANBcel1]|nr:hypothetical protein [Balneolales bacterium ANBcel1]